MGSIPRSLVRCARLEDLRGIDRSGFAAASTMCLENRAVELRPRGVDMDEQASEVTTRTAETARILAGARVLHPDASLAGAAHRGARRRGAVGLEIAHEVGISDGAVARTLDAVVAAVTGREIQPVETGGLGADTDPGVSRRLRRHRLRRPRHLAAARQHRARRGVVRSFSQDRRGRVASREGACSRSAIGHLSRACPGDRGTAVATLLARRNCRRADLSCGRRTTVSDSATETKVPTKAELMDRVDRAGPRSRRWSGARTSDR